MTSSQQFKCHLHNNILSHPDQNEDFFYFVGEISKSLFGTTTSADITTLQRHMQVLNKNNVKLAKAMVHQDQHLSAFINTVDKRFSNVLAAVKKNHQDAVTIIRLAHASMDALDHEF